MGDLGFGHPLHGPPTLAGERHPARYDIGWQDRDGANHLSCCAANGPRGLGALADWAVMTIDGGVVVNFYGPGSITVVDRTGAAVTVAQDTAYPTDGRIVLVVTAADGADRAVALRIPTWSAHSTVRVAGGPVTSVAAGGYHTVTRSWLAPTTIELQLDVSPRAVGGGPRPDGADPNSGGGAEDRTAFYVGPLLLAYDEREQAHRVDVLPRLRTTPQPFATDPRPAPGFPLVRARAEAAAGDVVVRDFATAGMPPMRVTAPPDVAGRAFQFGRALQQYGPGPAVLAMRLRLRPDSSSTATRIRTKRAGRGMVRPWCSETSGAQSRPGSCGSPMSTDDSCSGAGPCSTPTSSTSCGRSNWHPRVGCSSSRGSVARCWRRGCAWRPAAGWRARLTPTSTCGIAKAITCCSLARAVR